MGQGTYRNAKLYLLGMLQSDVPREHMFPLRNSRQEVAKLCLGLVQGLSQPYGMQFVSRYLRNSSFPL